MEMNGHFCKMEINKNFFSCLTHKKARRKAFASYEHKSAARLFLKSPSFRGLAI